ncbi:MAG: hypothetical protein ACYTFK_00385 [Planctomycetota bacterium]|jgi:hypothetical protein
MKPNNHIVKSKGLTIVELLVGFIIFILLLCVARTFLLNVPSGREKQNVIREGQPIVEAIYEYKNKKGVWPKSIEDFVPQYLEAMPNDLWRYSEGSLRRHFKQTRYLVGYDFGLDNVGWIGGSEGFKEIKPMQVVESNNFRIAVPKKYKVICHDIYKEQSDFFNNIDQLREGNEEIVSLVKSNPPDLEMHKGFYSYQIEMGKHFLVFYTLVDEGEPDDLEDFAASQTRHRPMKKADDIQINGIKGKKYGSLYWVAWLKKGDCLVCLSFEGRGNPSDEIKDKVSNILNSLEYIP